MKKGYRLNPLHVQDQDIPNRGRGTTSNKGTHRQNLYSKNANKVETGS